MSDDYTEKMAERLSTARNPINWSEMEFPDISCKKCGREIYCGVNSLCNDPNCELTNYQQVAEDEGR